MKQQVKTMTAKHMKNASLMSMPIVVLACIVFFEQFGAILADRVGCRCGAGGGDIAPGRAWSLT